MIAEHRKALGLSHEIYGMLIGTTGFDVHDWERGIGIPNACYADRIERLKEAAPDREAYEHLVAQGLYDLWYGELDAHRYR